MQGDTERRGELFGLENILTLRTDLSTKEQIEDAHLQNLDWALANEASGDSDDVSALGSLLPSSDTGTK